MLIASMILLAMLTLVFGPWGFLVGLANLISNILWYAWKGFEILDLLTGFLESLSWILQVLSLLG